MAEKKCWKDKERECNSNCVAYNIGDKVEISFIGEELPTKCLIIQILLADTTLSPEQLEIIFKLVI